MKLCKGVRKSLWPQFTDSTSQSLIRKSMGRSVGRSTNDLEKTCRKFGMVGAKAYRGPRGHEIIVTC